MPFKEIYELKGIADWCFTKPDLIARGLPGKYCVNVSVTIARNSKDKRNVNVYVDGLIIGFIDYPNTKCILDALEDHREVNGSIVEVRAGAAEGAPPSKVCVELSSYKSGYTRKRRGNFASEKPKPKKEHDVKPSNVRAESNHKNEEPLHRILKIPFSRQPLKKVPVRDHWGKVGIYCIWSTTHETYIGQSTNIGKRIRQHHSELESGDHANTALQTDWSAKGHAKFRFDLIEEIYDRTLLNEREEYFIRTFHTYENGYNATSSGKPIPGYQAPNKEPEQTKADPEPQVESAYLKSDFIDLFDGRYYLVHFQRGVEHGIVRIHSGDEVWCYKSDSEYHAELLVRWFAGNKRYKGSCFDWHIDKSER